MGGNPKDSEWYSMPRAARRRKGIEIMLPDAAREHLDALAAERGTSRSMVVEELIMGTPVKRRKRGAK